MKNNYYIYSTLVLIIILIGCAPKVSEDPQDLAGYTALLKEKKKELSAIQDEISRLTDKVEELDPALQEKAKLIEAVALSTSTFERFINIQGAVSADDMVNVVSEVPGRITMLNLDEGDYVRKGQLVATIDMQAIDKQVAEVNSALTLAQDVYERQSRLWDQKIGSEVQYLQAKNSVERLEKSLETLAFQKTKANIYAPISGVVEMEYLSQGEVTNPGMPIIGLLNTSKLKVSTDLPERYLKIIRKGQMVDLSFPSIDVDLKGRVSLLGRTIDASNRTLKVEITPTSKSPLLKPNLLAEIKLKEMSVDNVITIPLTYVLQEVDGKEFVYVIDDVGGESRAKKVYITTSESAEGVVIVQEGLTADDMLIGKGARSISNGELVKVQ